MRLVEKVREVHLDGIELPLHFVGERFGNEQLGRRHVAKNLNLCLVTAEV